MDLYYTHKTIRSHESRKLHNRGKPMSAIETETIDIDSVHPHPRNVRQGDIGAISESLKAHGQFRAITYQKSTGRILAGNHTWKAAKALGWKTIIASAKVCDDEQALRILLSDNRSSDLATYDDKELMQLLQDLAATGAELEGTLYDGDDLDDLIYKLEGSTGFVMEGNDINAIIGEYENKDTRNLSLPYSMEQIETIRQRLTELQTNMSIDDWSTIVWQLVEERHAGI
jgi:hypothetical protein